MAAEQRDTPPEPGIDPDSAAETGARERPVPQSEAAPETVDLERIAELEAQIATLKDELLRARAETDNIRKRAQRDVEGAHRFGLERFVAELVPVKDSLDWGDRAAAEAADLEALRKGFVLTAKLLADSLQKAGVTELNPVGEKFNAQYHQAMGMEARPDVAPGTILRVMQKGYLLNDRLVRPAMVIVARQLSEAQA